MMREREYRVWDKEEKRFFTPIFEGNTGKLEDLFISLNGRLIMHTLGLDGKTLLIHESCFPDRYEINQYTGLKDKNSKKIFEGDICKQSSRSQPEIIGEIRIESTRGVCVGFHPIWFHSVEIIGNVHQDPELLEDKL